MNFPLPEIFALKSPEYISVPEYNFPLNIDGDQTSVSFRRVFDPINLEYVDPPEIRRRHQIIAPVQVYITPAAAAALRG